MNNAAFKARPHCLNQVLLGTKMTIYLHQFDRIDHLMIEVEDPQAVYQEFYNTFALPQAWPLMSGDRYTSIGINFGNANLELITFKERFGVRNTHYSGLSGVCLTSLTDSENINADMHSKNLALLTGEDAPGHKTLVIANKDAPTIFVCYYKFNTEGWKIRLDEEFKKSKGGKFNVTQIAEVCVNNPLLARYEFNFCRPDSVTLRYAPSPEVRLKSTNTGLIGKSLVIGETLFTFC